jgi:hypothetical protein
MNRERASPLFSTGITSEMVPPPIVRGAELTAPSRKRKTIKVMTSGDMAHATVKQMKRTLHVVYTIERPWTSDNGATTRGPRPQPRT